MWAPLHFTAVALRSGLSVTPRQELVDARDQVIRDAAWFGRKERRANRQNYGRYRGAGNTVLSRQTGPIDPTLLNCKIWARRRGR